MKLFCGKLRHLKLFIMDSLYLGIGSNLGDRGENIKSALILLEKLGSMFCGPHPFMKLNRLGLKTRIGFIILLLRLKRSLIQPMF